MLGNPYLSLFLNKMSYLEIKDQARKGQFFPYKILQDRCYYWPDPGQASSRVSWLFGCCLSQCWLSELSEHPAHEIHYSVTILPVWDCLLSHIPIKEKEKVSIYIFFNHVSFIILVIKLCVTFPYIIKFSVQLLSCVWLCATPLTPGFPVHHQLPELAQIHVHWAGVAIQPSHPLSTPSPLSTIFPSIRVFSNESVLHSGSQSTAASASVLPMNIQDWFPLGLTSLISVLSKGLSRIFSNTTDQKQQFFSAELSLWSNSHIHTWLLERPQLWLYGPLLVK